VDAAQVAALFHQGGEALGVTVAEGRTSSDGVGRSGLGVGGGALGGGVNRLEVTNRGLGLRGGRLLHEFTVIQ
jgi:hypothetical protein